MKSILLLLLFAGSAEAAGVRIKPANANWSIDISSEGVIRFDGFSSVDSATNQFIGLVIAKWAPVVWEQRIKGVGMSKSGMEVREVLFIDEGLEDKRGNSWRIRVVEWVEDGKVVAANLEKREFYRKDGKKMLGRAVGLNFSDLQAIRVKMDEAVLALSAGRRKARKNLGKVELPF